LAFLDRRIELRRPMFDSAHSETCRNGCHSKLSSGSTSLDASLSLSVLNATKKIRKLKIAPTKITSHPGARPTWARSRKSSQNRSRSAGDVVGIGDGWT